MGFFNNNSDEEKLSREDKQIAKFMEKYQLEDLDEKDLIVLKRVANDLVGNGLFKMGMALSFAKAEEQAKVTYLSAIVEQNWIMIRQLGMLNKTMEELKNK